VTRVLYGEPCELYYMLLAVAGWQRCAGPSPGPAHSGSDMLQASPSTHCHSQPCSSSVPHEQPGWAKVAAG
jgi:hypothetical protein